MDRDAKQLRGVAQILRPLVHAVETRECLDADALAYDCDLLAVSYDNLTLEERALLRAELAAHRGLAPRQFPQVLYFSEGRCKEDFASLFSEHALSNLLARTDPRDVYDLVVTVQKILQRDIFGLEKYFAWGIEPETLLCSSSHDKVKVLEAVDTYARNVGVPSRLRTLFCNVADEFFTNAMYNAPTDSSGANRFARFPRSSPVTLDPGETVTVKFCCDGRRLGISILDPFGSLTAALVQDYLGKCFRRGEDQVDQKAGGAGLGFYQIFESLSHFIINLRPGKMTEMVGLLDISGNYREFAAKTKSFNLFTVDP